MVQRTISQRLIYNFFWTLFRLAGMLVCRLRFYGFENIPKEGGVLAVANHQSHLDPPFIGCGFPRRMNFLARRSLFDVPYIGRLIHMLDAIPIDRDGFGISGIKESLRRLKQDEVVLIFPEGTRSWDGEIAELRPGFTTLAVRSKASILPIAIDGAFQAWPRTRGYPLPGVVCVRFGKPISPDEYASLDDAALLALVETRLRECLAELRAQRKVSK